MPHTVIKSRHTNVKNLSEISRFNVPTTKLQRTGEFFVALAMTGLSQMVLFLPLLYSFVMIAANSVLKSTRIFHNDISLLCNEIS